jgi:hypothetical protein
VDLPAPDNPTSARRSPSAPRTRRPEHLLAVSVVERDVRERDVAPDAVRVDGVREVLDLGSTSRISAMRSALAETLEKSIDIFARLRIGL